MPRWSSRAAVNRILMKRAIGANCSLETLALMSPSMAAYPVLILRKPVDRAFLLSLINSVILPAVGLGRADRAGAEKAKAASSADA
ncbi:hypothetical protein [Rathayibacter soli]|uniref:hypothetical protein n=1 Tax=Rathayibacter soli TaxID=3144168 RepID=UPI0027E4D7F1|nr:hypothetical protein [Glaciibacter superstes]